MPYTGLLILAFIGVHLATFSHHIVDQTSRNIFHIAAKVFSHKVYLAIYLLSMIIVALHVRHGLWSAFQTVGANHPKYMPFIQKLSIVFAVIVGIGFGSLPHGHPGDEIGRSLSCNLMPKFPPAPWRRSGIDIVRA